MKWIPFLSAFALAAGAAVRPAAAAEPLRRTADIEALPGTAASHGRLFDLHAIADLPRRKRIDEITTLIVTDASGSTLLQNHVTNADFTVHAGDRLHATGRIVVEGGEVYADCYGLEVESPGPAPRPVQADVHALLTGAYDYRLTAVTGVVQDVFMDEIDTRWLHLLLVCGDEHLYVPVERQRYSALATNTLIGAELSISGRCFAANSGWRRRIGRTFRPDGPDAITVRRWPVSGLFEAPALEDCHRMRPSEIAQLGRRRLSGTVIAVWNGNIALLLTDDGNVVRTDFAESGAPRYGTRIEAVGFPESDLYRVNLTRAAWRPAPGRILEQAPAKDISARTLFTDERSRPRIDAQFHGCAIRLQGIVRSLPDGENPNKTLYLESDGQIMPVDFNACPRAGDQLSVGCRVEIAGTCVMDLENWRPNAVFPKIKGIFLAVRTPGDIRIIARPSWWTPARLLIVIAAMLAVILAVLVWNHALRTLAERRGRELTAETVSRVASELKVRERTRLAVELHDSIAQNLTGAIMEIRTGLRLGGDLAQRTDGHLALAQKTLESCRHELRNCLWDLRSRALEQDDMDKAIRQTLAPHIGTAALAIRFRVPRERISDNTTHAILRIVRELVANALRHGHATALKVAGSIKDGKLLFSVRDNGCGFDPEVAPGVEAGHFGLQGIRERVAALEGEMSIESAPGTGTKVTVAIRIPPAKKAKEDDT